jgi:hypothetical protein
VLCVVNLEKTANNPPPVPYVDINTLKKMFYYKTMYETPFVFMNLIETAIDKIKSYGDKLAEISGSEITKKVAEAVANYKRILKNAEPATLNEFNTTFENNLLTPEHNANAIKLFIESIDNSNAASTMGTLEFVDSVAKFNSVENICLEVDNEQRFISEGYVNVIDTSNSADCETEKIQMQEVKPDVKTEQFSNETSQPTSDDKELQELQEKIDEIKLMFENLEKGSDKNVNKKSNIKYSDLKPLYQEIYLNSQNSNSQNSNNQQTYEYGNVGYAKHFVSNIKLSQPINPKTKKNINQAFDDANKSINEKIQKLESKKQQQSEEQNQLKEQPSKQNQLKEQPPKQNQSKKNKLEKKFSKGGKRTRKLNKLSRV